MNEEKSLLKIHDLVLEMFDVACKNIVKENIEAHEFNFCVDAINTTIQYLKSKKENRNVL